LANELGAVCGKVAQIRETKMVLMASSRIFTGLIAPALLFGLAFPLHAKEFIKGERPQQRGYSQAVITEGGKTVWLAGQLAVVDDSGKSLAGDLDGQVRQIFKLINATLEKDAGCAVYSGWNQGAENRPIDIRHAGRRPYVAPRGRERLLCAVRRGDPVYQRILRLPEDALEGPARRDPQGWQEQAAARQNSGMSPYFSKSSGATSRKISPVPRSSGAIT
jgi:enamine deaminase RidA (YjgF/YER057c/UK114 family)